MQLRRGYTPGAAELLLTGNMPGGGIIAALAGLDRMNPAKIVLQENARAVSRFGQDEPGAVGPQAGIGGSEVVDRQAEEAGDGFGFVRLQEDVARSAATGAAAGAVDG